MHPLISQILSLCAFYNMLHKEYWKMSITTEFLAKNCIEKLPYILIEVILSSISIIKHLLRYKFQVYLGYSRSLCWGLFGLFRPQNEPFLIIENDKKVFPCRVIYIRAIQKPWFKKIILNQFFSYLGGKPPFQATVC